MTALEESKSSQLTHVRDGLEAPDVALDELPSQRRNNPPIPVIPPDPVGDYLDHLKLQRALIHDHMEAWDKEVQDAKRTYIEERDALR